MNDESGVSAAPVPTEDHSALAGRLELDDAVLSSTDLRRLGHTRRSVDAIWRGCGVVALPGYGRPLVKVADYRAYIEAHTFKNDGTAVR